MYAIADLYDLDHSLAKEYLSCFTYPWEALGGIHKMILSIGPALTAQGYEEIAPQVWAHRTAVIASSAFLGAACIIGPETEVRHGAFVRGSALIGCSCVVGNSTEIKNAILFDGVQAPHYNYVGDSILGYLAHMGAGSITSNVRGDKAPVTVRMGAQAIPTGLKKLGAMLGDRAEIGCNAVLNPGTLIGPNSQVYPLSCVRGTLPAGCIWKQNGTVIPKN